MAAVLDDCSNKMDFGNARGLECRTKAGRIKKRALRMRAYDAVMNEQYEQRLVDCQSIDFEAIAAEYQEVSREAVQEARRLALQDELVVRREAANATRKNGFGRLRNSQPTRYIMMYPKPANNQPQMLASKAA